MAEVVSLRLPADLLEWSTEYAKSRGVSRTDLLVQGLLAFRESCEHGRPEITPRPRQTQAKASGSCPKHEPGHVWASHQSDPRRRCVHCGLPARGDHTKDEQGNLAVQTARRAELFSGLKAPMLNGTGKPEKAEKADARR